MIYTYEHTGGLLYPEHSTLPPEFGRCKQSWGHLAHAQYLNPIHGWGYTAEHILRGYVKVCGVVKMDTILKIGEAGGIQELLLSNKGVYHTVCQRAAHQALSLIGFDNISIPKKSAREYVQAHKTYLAKWVQTPYLYEIVDRVLSE